MNQELINDLKEIHLHLFSVIDWGHGGLGYTTRYSKPKEIEDFLRSKGFICALQGDDRIYVSTKNLTIRSGGEGGDFHFYIHVEVENK